MERMRSSICRSTGAAPPDNRFFSDAVSPGAAIAPLNARSKSAPLAVFPPAVFGLPAAVSGLPVTPNLDSTLPIM
jgi:hypothetical protein